MKTKTKYYTIISCLNDVYIVVVEDDIIVWCQILAYDEDTWRYFSLPVEMKFSSFVFDDDIVEEF